MLRFLSSQKGHLVPDDATDSSVSSIPYPSDTFRSARSTSSRVSSTTSYASKALVPVGSYEIPHLTKTPWELGRNKKKSAWRRTQFEHVFSAQYFRRLPKEVYECIVNQLELLHFEPDQACPSCYLKDMCSLSLTSRSWDCAVTPKLYRKPWVLTNENETRMRKVKLGGISRLKLFRRTLRERNALARYVRELYMPDFQSLYRNASIEREEIVNLIASVVMACPNLERLVGFNISYNHSFDRLSHALSTKGNLKERVWLLSQDEFDPDHEDDDELNAHFYHRSNDPTECFLDLNSKHPNLTTLVIHQQHSYPTPLAFRAIIGTFRQYPSLRHLCISNMSTAAFSNLALNALPPNLQSLRLENLPGINDKGIRRFATSSLPSSLESLALINLEISNIVTISQFLSPSLGQLKRFTLSQAKTPILPSEASIPYLQSATLEYIHWEFQSQAGPPPNLIAAGSLRDSMATPFPFPNDEPISCLATCILAANIRSGLFPSLLKIRIPHDPQGLLQSLCKPRATALLPFDRALLTSPPRPSSVISHNTPSSFDSVRSNTYSDIPSRVDSPMSATFPSHNSSRSSAESAPSNAITPAHSRLAAQNRILAARRKPVFLINIIDPEDNVVATKTIYGFLGQLDSRISYEVKPDRQRMVGAGVGNEGGVNGWLMGVADVMGEWEEVGNLKGCRHFAEGGKGFVGVRRLF
ncbi:hypothetical protein CC78DRAFT_603238 [Lojkania enalia]|uniref:F-box domain-containing protein n=1 Tax=Lojkania enalia TaxID=147567 RepID=A0A9P4K9T6_9PLEO|nr:hypothetical protein CC78DRAFT_603238 [Didymosphaeria enalia]